MSAVVAVRPVIRGPRTSTTVRRQPVRLTRRGRLALVLSVLLTMLVGGVSLSQVPLSAEGHVVKPDTVTVRTGETLWGVAVRIAPHADPRLVVAEIERLNQMHSPAVFGGQQLVVPRAQ